MAEDMNLQINITGTNDTGGSFDSLDSAMADLQKLAMDVSKAFEDFARSVSSTMSAASSSVDEMISPLQAEQAELEALVQSMGDVDRAAQSMGETGAQAGREMQASLNGVAQAGTEVGRGMNDAQQGLNNTRDAANNANGSMEQFSQALGTEMIGEQLKSIGESGMHMFEGAIESSAEFEFNISKIGAVLTTVGKASNDQMGQMAEDALKLGSNSTFSANEIASGMYDLARQGLDATTILGDGVNGAINIVNDLAQATDSNMNDTATVITDVVHEYGLSGAELRNVANIISGTLHNSSESLDMFYQSMKQVGPVASAMHQSVEDVSTSLAILAQHGITGSSAGTAMKNMLLGLEPHTAKAAALMKDLGISAKEGAANSFYQLNGNLKPLPDIIQILNDKFGGLNDKQKEAALATTFTKYGLAGLNTIVTESKDKFQAFQEELKKDDAATIAAKKMDNLHGDLLKFNAGVQTMMKSFGDTMNGMLRPLVQGASQVIKYLTELPKPAKEAGMIILGLGSALAIAGGSVIAFAGGVKMLGPSLEMAGFSTAGLEAAAGTLGAVFSEVLIPIALVVAAVAAVALGFKLAYDHIKPFHDAVDNVISSVKQVANALKGLWSGGAAEGKGISILDNLGFSPAAISAIQNVFARIKEGVAAAKQGFDNVKSAVQGIFMILTGTGGGKGMDILQKLGFSKATIGKLMKMGGQFKATFDAIKTAVTSSVNGIGSTVRSFINKLLTFWNTHQYQFRQTVQQVWKAIGDFLRSTVSSLISIVGNAVTTILNFWNQHHKQIQQTAMTVWNTISSVVKTTITIVAAIIQYLAVTIIPILWTAFQDILKTAIQAFNGLLNVIGPALQTIFAWWNQYWPEIKQVFEFIWQQMIQLLGPAIALIGEIIVAALGFIKGAWHNGWLAIVDVLKWIWDAIKGVIKVAWDIISGIIAVALDLLTGHFSKAGTDFINIFINVFRDITSTFSNMAQDAWDFGVNFVKMLAGGITSTVGAVTSAVAGVADKVKSFLGFHSPTEEGAASDSDRWGPNFVNMMAKGIQEHIPTIQSAVSTVALGIKAGFTTPLTQNISQTMALPGGIGTSSGPTIIVYANGNITRNERELGDIVSRAILDKTKMQGKF